MAHRQIGHKSNGKAFQGFKCVSLFWDKRTGG